MEDRNNHLSNFIKKEPSDKAYKKKTPVKANSILNQSQANSPQMAKLRVSPRLFTNVESSIIDPTQVSIRDLKSLGKSKTGLKIISVENPQKKFEMMTGVNIATLPSKSDGANSLQERIDLDSCHSMPSLDSTDSKMSGGSSDSYLGVNNSGMNEKKICDDNGNNSQIANSEDNMAVSKSSRNKRDFPLTPTEDCDSLELNDIMADFTGYVDQIKGREKTDRHGYVMHLVLNNGDEREARRIMLTGWNTHLPKLEAMASLGNVIEVKGVMVKFKEMNRYNHGNMDKFLEVQEYTTLKLLGKVDVNPDEHKITDISFDSITKVRGIIRILGHVKTAPRLMESEQYGSKVIGAISDGKKVIELHLPEKAQVHHINKGEKVQVKGTLVTKKNGLHYLKVEKSEDIAQIPGEPMKNLEWFLDAHIHF